MQIMLAYGASLWLALLGHVSEPTKPRPSPPRPLVRVRARAPSGSVTPGIKRADAPAVTGKPRSHYYSSQTILERNSLTDQTRILYVKHL